MRTILHALFISLVVSWPFASPADSRFPDTWDSDFRHATGRYMPGVDWRLLKAQCYQESLLRPDAVSPVGAQGLCQFMPGTWREVSGALRYPTRSSAFAPDLSIEAAAYYMGRLRRQWSAPRPEWDRHNLAMASYNAGLGHLLTAQRLCSNASDYDTIVGCLPRVTGRHSKETTTYVERIRKWWKLMLWAS